MEVSTTVTRYKYLSQHMLERDERAHRVHVCQVDFKQGKAPKLKHLTSRVELCEALVAQQSALDARVYVVEDLSRDMIELLGSTLDIDPHFFRAHVDDYMWNTQTKDAVERKRLDMLCRKQSHFRVRYLRPRYYRDTASFVKATKQAGQFNVLRHLDSDRSRDSLQDDVGAVATLMRAKASLWVRSNCTADQGALGRQAGCCKGGNLADTA